MATAYYRQDTDEMLGNRTFEKAGEEKPRPCFTWSVNPAFYLWNAEAHVVREEGGRLLDRSEFVLHIVGNCQVQRYDERNIPA